MNIGVDEFRRSAVLLRLNEGALLQAAAALEQWRKADFEGERIVVDALIRRRAAEKALFLTPADGYVPTPTPVVRPRFDFVPSEAALADAVELSAPLDGETAGVQREIPPEGAPAEPAPSSTELAAESVTTRLQAILDDLDLSGAGGSVEPPIVQPLPDPSSHARRQQEQTRIEPFPQPAAEAAAHSVDEPVAPFHMSDFDLDRIERGPASYLPLALMLVVGVALLAVATFWFVHAHPDMGSVAPSVIGWILGLAGIGLLATSVYFLLERIGRDDE
jgi:lysozyme